MSGKDVMYDVVSCVCRIKHGQKKRVSEDKNVPQTIWRYKRGVAQTDGVDVVSNTKIEAVIFVTYSKLEEANFKSARARIQRFQAFATV
jgi:hypothetical protein